MTMLTAAEVAQKMAISQRMVYELAARESRRNGDQEGSMIHCTHCHRKAELVTGREIYPHRPDLARRMFWRCEPCGAYVGCHRPNKRLGFKGAEPLGTLANAELRRARNRAHAAFDPIWRSGSMTRADAYAWLSKQIGTSAENTHIALLDMDGCAAVIAAVAQRGEAA